MSRLVKKIDRGSLHNRETFIKDVANRSLTTEHCQFFLKKYGSDKVFHKYISKYYPQNGGCSFHMDCKNRVNILPSIRQKSKSKQKENKYDISRSIHQQKNVSKFNEISEFRHKKVNSLQFFGFKLNQIIKKIKTQHQEDY